MDTLRYVLAVVVWATIPPAFFFWFLIHPFAEYWRGVGPARTYLVVGPVCLVLLGVLARWRGPVAGSDLGENWLIFYAGIGLWITSAFMERRIRRHLDFKTLAGVPELKPLGADERPRLLDEGPYARVRHPRYVSVFVGTLGWAMMSNHGAAYGVAAAIVPAILLLVRLEERELLERFGDTYRQYQALVPALVPRLRRS